jgi:catechol 2,3-dioxygenase-like lactoylglutathione lyase family enzyme
MLSHVHIGVLDFDREFAFYKIVMEELGYPLKFFEPEKPWAGWKPSHGERPLFLIGLPFNGQDAAAGNGQMTALLASSRGDVDRAYRAAITAGAQDEGPPGLRPEYHESYYGAYFRDPSGNKICVCCHEPE